MGIEQEQFTLRIHRLESLGSAVINATRGNVNPLDSIVVAVYDFSTLTSGDLKMGIGTALVRAAQQRGHQVEPRCFNIILRPAGVIESESIRLERR